MQVIQFPKSIPHHRQTSCRPPSSDKRQIQKNDPGANRKANWLLGAAAVGLVAAVLMLGHGTKPREELDWLSRLASSGDTGAQLQLGLAYRQGRYGLSPDPKTGLYWLEQAAAGGDAYAADQVGTAYASGRGTAIDLQAAEHWWRKAAEAGDGDAEIHLAEQLIREGHAQEAESWLKKAVSQSAPGAESRLRNLHGAQGAPASAVGGAQGSLGTLAHPFDTPGPKTVSGVVKLLEKTDAQMQSAAALEKRAQEGDPVAEYRLGMRYRDGSSGVSRDPAKALQWLRRSAKAGNKVAMKTLADMYQHGFADIEPDPARAAAWARRATGDA